MYGVMAGVHRANDLWYNKKVLQKYGITVGDKMTFDEFFAAAEKLKVAGVSPLAVGDTSIWAATQLFENVLLGVVGADGWKDLFSGKMAWDDPKVKEALKLYGRMLQYENTDHGALTWDQAVAAVIEGRCAFNSMGDWAYGEFAKAKLKDNEDFGWVASPGTEKVFLIASDAFTLAKDAPHPAEAKAWLAAIGSKEAEEAFCPLKGAIPTRTDVDKSKFGPYQQWAINTFSNSTLLPSCVNGSAASAAFQQSLNDAITEFVVDKKVDKFAAAIVKASKDTLRQ
jgi:glucose/mannose transport system substrate-binding protein